MSEKPNIKWIGSPYFGYPRGTHGRNGHTVVAIVNHIMVGTLTGTDSWFNSPNNTGGTSAHFGVGKNGEIHQYVDINDIARHAGIVKNPSWPLLIEGVNPNYYTIGIEHEGYPGDEFTEAQFQATLALHKWLIALYKLPVSENTIIGHYRINSVDKGNCPGPTFPWKRLFANLGPMPDVPADHWAARSVARVLDAGLMSGYPDGKFQGDKPATRYELASALDRLMRKGGE